MAQVARNLTEHVDGFIRSKRFLVVDRDSKFDALFRSILNAAGVHVLQTARRAPNMNSFAERFVLSIKSECLDRLILFGERMLRRALAEFLTHYHQERNHQSLANQLIAPDPGVAVQDGTVRCRERLGGLLRFYHRRRRVG